MAKMSITITRVMEINMSGNIKESASAIHDHHGVITNGAC